MRLMGDPRNFDTEARDRVLAWLRFYMRIGTPDEMSRAQAGRNLGGVAGQTISNIINKKRTPGLDFLLALRGAVHRPMDTLCDEWPRRALGQSPRRPSRGGERSGGIPEQRYCTYEQRKCRECLVFEVSPVAQLAEGRTDHAHWMR
jgi:hypothetical protein